MPDSSPEKTQDHPPQARIECLRLCEQAQEQARRGNLAAAFAVLSRAQQTCPAEQQAWQLAGALATQIRDWQRLQHIASSWTQLHPASISAWQTLSRSHFEQSQFSEAIEAFSRVLALAPDNASHLVSAARMATAAGHYQAAREQLTAAENITPDAGDVLYALSRLYHLTGELDKAEAYCRRAIGVLPNFAPAYIALGMLCEGRLTEPETNAVRRLAQTPGIHPEYQALLNFTLGDALDRQGNHGQAFDAWQEANRINALISEQEGFTYTAAQHEADLRLLDALFAEPVSVPVPDSENATPNAQRPIFIVGMPRSGTTLIESILASHSDVVGAGELPALPEIHEELMQVARNQSIAAARQMLQTQAATWRTRYLNALPAGDNANYVVDKQPMNYRSVGLIRVLFPDSPIIHTRRAPMDVGLSIYRHNFSRHWPCAHRLEDIGHYYGVYERIGALWQSRYPESVHIVEHAALVSDPDAKIRQLLDFVRLDLQPACLTPHKTKRPVATFSSVQVQRPVSASYSNRSAPYNRQLEPLRNALNSSGIDVASPNPK